LPSSSNDNGNEINNDNQKLDEITKQIEDKTPINVKKFSYYLPNYIYSKNRKEVYIEKKHIIFLKNLELIQKTFK